jgi:hypothetical protein
VAVSAEDFCDLRVLVRSADGRPIEAPVIATGLDGRILARTSSFNGAAELCDVGIREFSVTVGSDKCGQVTIGRLRTTASQTLTLPVILEYCHMQIAFTSCQVLIRVRSGDKPVAGASLRVNGQDFPGVLSDAMGRIRTALPIGSRNLLEVSAGGIQERAGIDCGADKDEVEVVVDLRGKRADSR